MPNAGPARNKDMTTVESKALENNPPKSKAKTTRAKKATKKNPQARKQAEKRVELDKKIFYLQQFLIDSNVSENVLKEAVCNSPYYTTRPAHIKKYPAPIKKIPCSYAAVLLPSYFSIYSYFG